MSAVNGVPGKWSTINITVAALTALSASLVIITGVVAFIGGAMMSAVDRQHIEALQSSYYSLANSFTEMKGDVKRMQGDISEMRQKR
jgi:hypothetical protein